MLLYRFHYQRALTYAHHQKDLKSIYRFMSEGLTMGISEYSIFQFVLKNRRADEKRTRRVHYGMGI